MIPLRDSIRLLRLPVVTIALIAVNVLVYLIAVGISIAIQGHPGGGLTFHG